MKKDGKELISMWNYDIVEYGRKKMVYRTEDNKEHYIKTKDEGFVRVYRRGACDCYSTVSVKESVVDKLPPRLAKTVENHKRYIAELETARKEYASYEDYRADERYWQGIVEGLCEALYLAGIIKSEILLSYYIYGTAE